MRIKTSLYETLTPQERVVASLEAVARGDDTERQRLVTTCPRQTYTMTDHRFSRRMEALMCMQMALETDMRGLALDYILMTSYTVTGGRRAVLDAPKNPGQIETLDPQIEPVLPILRTLLGLQQAWQEFLQEQNIDPDLMERPMQHMASPRHFAVTWLLEALNDLHLEPDPESIQAHKTLLTDWMNKAIS